MSLTTLTPSALAAEARYLQMNFWRATAAPPTRESLALTDSDEDHDTLERLLQMPGLAPMMTAAELGEPFLLTPPPRGTIYGDFTDAPLFEGARTFAGALYLLARERGRLLTDQPELKTLPPVPVVALESVVIAQVLDLRRRRFRDPKSLFYGRITLEQAPVFSMRHLVRTAREAGIGAVLTHSEGLALHDWSLIVLTHEAMLPGTVSKPRHGTLRVSRGRAEWRGDGGDTTVVPTGFTNDGPRPSTFFFFPDSMLGSRLPFDGEDPYEC